MSIGKMRDGCFEFETKCGICGKARNGADHRKCSKIKQKMYEAERAREGSK